MRSARPTSASGERRAQHAGQCLARNLLPSPGSPSRLERIDCIDVGKPPEAAISCVDDADAILPASASPDEHRAPRCPELEPDRLRGRASRNPSFRQPCGRAVDQAMTPRFVNGLRLIGRVDKNVGIEGHAHPDVSRIALTASLSSRSTWGRPRSLEIHARRGAGFCSACS